MEEPFKCCNPGILHHGYLLIPSCSKGCSSRLPVRYPISCCIGEVQQQSNIGDGRRVPAEREKVAVEFLKTYVQSRCHDRAFPLLLALRHRCPQEAVLNKWCREGIGGFGTHHPCSVVDVYQYFPCGFGLWLTRASRLAFHLLFCAKIVGRHGVGSLNPGDFAGAFDGRGGTGDARETNRHRRCRGRSPVGVFEGVTT